MTACVQGIPVTPPANTSLRRGKRAEVVAVNWLRTHGHPEARRTLAGDGRQPGDIAGVTITHPQLGEIPLCIEVKDVARSSWPAWCRQAAAQACGGPWTVVRRHRGTRDAGQWACVAHLPWQAGRIDTDAQLGATIRRALTTGHWQRHGNWICGRLAWLIGGDQ